MDLLLRAIYFAAPAYFAGIVPVILSRLKWFEFLNKPIDFYNKIGRQYIFGSHKTWRGLISAPIAGILVAYVQYILHPSLKFISIINYSRYWFLFGLLAGLGVIIGDLVKSFFKRRLNISSGKPWPFFDQIDAIIGFLLFTYYLARPNYIIVIIIVLLGLLAAVLSNIIAYVFRIKKVWW